MMCLDNYFLGGRVMLDRDLPLKKEIAKNLKSLMKDKGLTQIKLSELSGVSKSTLSDYMNCKTLINLGNVEKLASALNVDKSKIDPSFSQGNQITKKEKSVSTIAAHIDENITEEELKEIMTFIEFLKSQRN